jgi:hypothetical protein
MFEVKKAKRQRRPLKVNLEGLSGSGKTFSALRLAMAMVRRGIGKRIVVADSENDSADLYADVIIDDQQWSYETCRIPLTAQNPSGYTQAYEYLVGQGFDIIVFDSLSHAWHGAMEQVDQHASRNKNDKFGAWAKVTPEQRRMIQTLTDNRAHLIATMRVKSEYERVEGSNGRDKIKKVGLKTDQREGTEYEFDVVVRLEQNHDATVEKVRGCTAMDGRSANSPGPAFWEPLFAWWLGASDPVAESRAAFAAAKSAAELKAAWDATPGEVKPIVLADKDRRKLELAPPAQQPPVSPPSPEPTAETAEAELLSGQAMQAFVIALTEFELTWPAAAAQYGPEIGFPGNAKVNEITVAQSQELLRLARADSQG